MDKDKSLETSKLKKWALNIYKEKQNFEIKNSPLELKKDFKPANISLNDMDKFKEKEITKKRKFANTWYNWYNSLISYIPEPITKWVVLKSIYESF